MIPIRGAILVAAALALMLVPMLLSSPPAAAPDPSAYFSAEQIAQADRYASLRVPISLASIVISTLALILLAVGPAARALGASITRLTSGRWLLTAVLLSVIVSLLPRLLTLPLSLMAHRVDRDFGLATNSTGAFLSDVGRSAIFGLVLTTVAGLGFVALARLLPKAWPVVTAAGGAAMLLALVFLLPVVYEPVFNRFVPVSEPTRSRILALADEVGVPVSDVLVADASKRTVRHNAYVSGIGATRRVVLYDTLVEGAPPDEVDLVVVHELAHVRFDDVRNGTLLGMLGVVAGVGVLSLLIRSGWASQVSGASGAGDPRIVVFLAAFVAVAGLVTAPLQNLVSRQVEARADRFAIAQTGNVDTAVSLEQRLARTNMSDLTPNRVLHLFFGSHPTIMERIGIALETEDD